MAAGDQEKTLADALRRLARSARLGQIDDNAAVAAGNARIGLLQSGGITADHDLDVQVALLMADQVVRTQAGQWLPGQWLRLEGVGNDLTRHRIEEIVDDLRDRGALRRGERYPGLIEGQVLNRDVALVAVAERLDAQAERLDPTPPPPAPGFVREFVQWFGDPKNMANLFATIVGSLIVGLFLGWVLGRAT